MTSEERLGTLYAAIRTLGFPALVMGGHAARFYGIDRTTIDYDLHVIVEDAAWNRFGDELQRSPLFTSAPLVEGPSWRPAEFNISIATIQRLSDEARSEAAKKRGRRKHQSASSS